MFTDFSVGFPKTVITKNVKITSKRYENFISALREATLSQEQILEN
jgi:hypothetical protein